MLSINADMYDRVACKKQELLTLSEHLSSPRFFMGSALLVFVCIF